MWKISTVLLENTIVKTGLIVFIGSTKKGKQYKHELQILEHEMILKIQSITDLMLKDRNS